MYDGVLAEGQVAVRTVHRSQHEVYLGYAMGHCRHMGKIGDLAAVQVFWPDNRGAFPFEPDCDPDVCALQRRLDLAVPWRELRAHRRKYGAR